MQSQLEYRLFDVQMSVGFDFEGLSPEAVAHERTPEFKRCVHRLLEREVGSECLEEFSGPHSDAFGHVETKTGTVNDEDLLGWVGERLADAPGDLGVARIEGRICQYSPPDKWKKIRIVPIYRRGRPLTVEEAVEDYERRRDPKCKDPMDRSTRMEFSAMRLQLLVSWVVELPSEGTSSNRGD